MLRRSVILVGLPGSGKSSVGRAVANRMGAKFVDLDLEIESKTGSTVAQLFANQGEAAFRKLEYETTAELAAGSPAVWAPGGGWAAIPGVLALVRPDACIIHLAVSPRGALARLRQHASIRPLLRVLEPEAELNRLRQERAAAYAAADFVVDTESTDIEHVVDQVEQLARAWNREGD